MCLHKIARHGLLIIIPVIFLSIFSHYTSPLTNVIESDSAFFLLVGQGMSEGLLPYRDFFDMKGPYLFLIEYIGQFFITGRSGIFIVQIFFFYFSLLTINKILRLALGDNSLFYEFLLLLPVLWVAAATFQGGNLTEEFSLPALLVCFYFYMLYMVGNKKMHPPIYAMVYGISFGFLAFIRITNAASICAIILCILTRLLFYRAYRNIFENAVCFLCGILISSTPVLIWGYFNGILPDMIFQVFTFGYVYAAEDGIISFSFSWRTLLFIFPVIACALSTKKSLFLADMAINSALLYLALSMGNDYLHYYTLLIPLIVLGVYFCADFFIAHGMRICPFLLSLFLSISCLLPATYNHVEYYIKVFMRSALTDMYIDYDAINISYHIPQSELDSVYTYETDISWYIWAQSFPCIKYCAWQNHYIALMPEIKKELQVVFQENAPKWLVFDRGEEIPEFMRIIVQDSYALVAENNSYLLYNYTYSGS